MNAVKIKRFDDMRKAYMGFTHVLHVDELMNYTYFVEGEYLGDALKSRVEFVLKRVFKYLDGVPTKANARKGLERFGMGLNVFGERRFMVEDCGDDFYILINIDLGDGDEPLSIDLYSAAPIKQVYLKNENRIFELHKAWVDESCGEHADQALNDPYTLYAFARIVGAVIMEYGASHEGCVWHDGVMDVEKEMASGILHALNRKE